MKLEVLMKMENDKNCEQIYTNSITAEMNNKYAWKHLVKFNGAKPAEVIAESYADEDGILHLFICPICNYASTLDDIRDYKITCKLCGTHSPPIWKIIRVYEGTLLL